MITLLTTIKMTVILSLIDLSEIRTEFQKAASDNGYREEFHQMVCAERANNATTLAYQGSAKAMMADVVFNPYNKYSLFKEGTEMIDLAVDQEPKNAEIRYLRFLIQSQSPSFLGYDEHIEEDFNIIIKTIGNSAKKESWMRHFEAFVKSNNQAVPNG